MTNDDLYACITTLQHTQDERDQARAKLARITRDLGKYATYLINSHDRDVFISRRVVGEVVRRILDPEQKP